MSQNLNQLNISFILLIGVQRLQEKKKGYTGYTNNFKVEAFYGFYFNELSQ